MMIKKVMAFLFFGVALFLIQISGPTSGVGVALAGNSGRDPLPASIVSNEPFQVLPVIYKEIVKVKAGENLSLILSHHGVIAEKRNLITESLKNIYSPRSFKIGQVLNLTFEGEGEQKVLRSIDFYKDDKFLIAVEKTEEGQYKAVETPIKWRSEIVYSDGTIINGLYSDALKGGFPQPIILKMIDYFSYDVDFQRDIHGGDRFQVVYEKKIDESGKIVQMGDILYANLILSGDPNPIFRYELENGQVVYLNEKGESFQKTLLKTPVDGSRISSGFSGKRKHPILGYKRGHRGVDFAVSAGTPIKVAGDGVIVKRESSNSYGNFIKVQHRNGYQTLYAHMRAFSSKYNIGSKVSQGDIIGYVGCTGWCTGPHLHYEVIYSNRHINPQNLKQPASLVLKGKTYQKYRSFVESFLGDFRIKWDDDSYTVDNNSSKFIPRKNS